MKLTTSIAAIAAAISGMAFVSQAQTSEQGYGTRVDFLDKDGKRIESQYPKMYTVAFFFQNNGNGLSARTSLGQEISSMDFIPWGTESYPVTIETPETPEGEKVDVTWEVINTSDSKRRIRKANESGDVLCGATIRLNILVPKGSFPKIDIGYLYTNTNSEGEPYMQTLSGNGMDYMYQCMFNLRSGLYIQPINREFILKNLENTSIFVRDAQNPDLWHADLFMQNEPMSFKVYCGRNDSELLADCTVSAMTSMYTQYQQSGNTEVNGDPWIGQMLGENMSGDLISCLMDKRFSSAFSSWNRMNDSRMIINGTPWVVCFSMIRSANLLLDNIDKFDSATEAERKLARARMLTLRSHAYWRLLQIFAPRWCDSNNGAMVCAPLETTFSKENFPLASMSDIIARCYSDLDEAARIFADNRSDDGLEPMIIIPNRNVALGVKMRIAMIKEDWTTVKSLANEILQNVPLTKSSELTSGFMEAAPSWIWGSYDTIKSPSGNVEFPLYYWAFQSFYTCNGPYPCTWDYGPNAIDKDLYLSIDPTDIRRSLFAMPDQLDFRPFNDLGNWYKTTYAEQPYFYATTSSGIKAASRLFSNFYENKKPELAKNKAFHYGSTWDDYNKNYIPVQFGAQVKFYSSNDYGGGAVVFLRSDEVILSLAEANFRLGDESAAREALVKLNSMRQANYVCNAYGDDLMAEIRRSRKIELWGEGHSWFDMKRWNLPIRRSHWVGGDAGSGNWPASFGTELLPEQYNGWRYLVPASEVKYNPNVDLKSLGYTNAEGYDTTSAPRKTPAHALKVSVNKEREATMHAPITID